MESRSHVIAFKNIMIESSVLKENDTYKVRVKESGHYQYYCQIYTRMKGVIEVYDPQKKPLIVQTYDDISKLMLKQAAALPLGSQPEVPKDNGSCIFRT